MRPKPGGAIALAVVLAACSAEGIANERCLRPPCALPVAVTIRLTSTATGDPVEGATVRVVSPFAGSIPCQGSTCYVMGSAGTYALTVEAPGFQAAQRTVMVRGSTPPCGCLLVETERLDLALIPAS